MENQSAVQKLRESIRLLEHKQAEDELILKNQFRLTFESLKPINLLKSYLKDLTSSGDIKNSLLETVISILSGYLTKKLVVSSTSNIFTKLLGAVLQYSVTAIVSQNADSIRTMFIDLVDRFIKPAPEVIEE